MHIIDPESKEFVRVPVAASEAGADINVTTQPVAIAIVPTGAKPDVGAWKTAEWETDPSSDPDTYYARLLIGPTSGNFILTLGEIYDVYVRVTDNPEIPIRNAGAVAAF
jgi:hypothetical protein